jgi:hypothetical protein
MRRKPVVVPYVLAMVVVVVGVDVLFLRGLFWERLLTNIGIVLVFGAFYLRFLRRA